MLIAIGVSALLAPSTPVRAQVIFDGTQTDPSDAVLAVCTSDGYVYSNFKDNCETGLTGGEPFLLKGIAFGGIYDSTDSTYLDANGDAYFEHYLQIDGEMVVNGSAEFNDGLTADGLLTSNDGITNHHGFTNSGGIVNTGGITSSGAFINNASFTNNGDLTVRDKLSTDTFTANSAEIAGYMVVGAHLTGNNGATFSDMTSTYDLSASHSLRVLAGASVDMGGARVQNVGAPEAGTDAVNKDYVDSLANTAQTTAETALADAEAAQATADTARVEAAAAQATADTGLARTENLGASGAAALGGGAAYDEATGVLSAPSYTVAGESYDSVGAAFEAVDEQLSLIDDRVTSLSAATGRGFRQANGGIAAAMALGGTMIVPDSAVSISFNLATYRGQQGFAGVVAVRAAPKVFVSGGVTGSTVRGSTGGRVGVAFGF